MGVSSMTGFARAEGEADGISWIWELKSVNSRSLDLRLRLPPGFDALEPQLRAALARRVRRGSISATLSVNRLTPPTVRVNRAMLDQIVALLGELSGKVDAAAPRLDGLIGLRGVIETVEDEPESVVEERRAAVVDGWSLALDRLATARTEEGARLAAVLSDQRAELAALVEAAAGVCGRAARGDPGAARNPAGRACRACPDDARGAGRTGTGDAGRPRRCPRGARPAARPYRRRPAISWQRGEAIGRQLDFLCQEFNREANTLCSKSADVDLTRIGLALKAAIEQFREQVQNIE